MKENHKKEKRTTEAPLISQAKAAEMCGMTRAAIRDLVHRGRFSSVEVQGRTLVPLQEVEAFDKERSKLGRDWVALKH